MTAIPEGSFPGLSVLRLGLRREQFPLRIHHLEETDLDLARRLQALLDSDFDLRGAEQAKGTTATEQVEPMSRQFHARQQRMARRSARGDSCRQRSLLLIESKL